MPTHGSLSKAGKVRSQTPKIQGTPKTAPSPKTRNRRNFEKTGNSAKKTWSKLDVILGKPVFSCLKQFSTLV